MSVTEEKRFTLLDAYSHCLICREPNVAMYIASLPAREEGDDERRGACIVLHANGTACFGEGVEGHYFEQGYTMFDVTMPLPGMKQVPEEELRQITMAYSEEKGYLTQQLVAGYTAYDLPMISTALHWGLSYLGHPLVECFEHMPGNVLFDKDKWPAFTVKICRDRERKLRGLIAAHQAGKTPEEMATIAQTIASAIKSEEAGDPKVVNVGGEITGSGGVTDIATPARPFPGPENR